MKFMMIAALAVAVATPALAQTTPAPTTPDTSMAQPATTPDATTAPTAAPAANDSAATSAPAAGSYPMCSRTVTDSCTERSNAAGARLHSTPRPHKK
jgi:hypothetical protein